MKIALGVAYEGTHYSGWQCQPHTKTVQATLESALSRLATHPVRVISAGRTDQGVHASHQVAHFKTNTQRDMETWKRGVNYYLPKDIRLLWIQPVMDDFHARFSALQRTYQYLIYQGSMPWYSAYSWQLSQPLHIEEMQKATAYLLGEHDFTSFRAAQCQSKSPIRHLQALSITSQGEVLQFTITANAFLHHMVRNLMGVLIEVGQGRRSAESMPSLLASRDRQQAGITAPAQGLYLQSIGYPERFQIPPCPEALTEQLPKPLDG